MPDDVASEDLRPAIRRRALANFILALLAEAARTHGRLAVHPFGTDAVCLRYRDVRTLVRHAAVFSVETRDFEVVVAAPPRWPFERSAALLPVVLRPQDFAHPNSDGRGF